MKIAWFTPFCKKSAIGKYSSYVTQILSKDITVDLYVSSDQLTDEADRGLLPTECKVITYDSSNVADQLGSYDLCVYNMGDNAVFHAKIYDVFLRHPGIVIAHDVCMHNFARGYYVWYKNKPEQYIKRLREKYGKDASAIAAASQQSETWNELDFFKYSFSESVFERATGVIVHSKHHKKFLQKYYAGRIIEAPLLYPSNDNSDGSVNSDEWDADKMHILTVGNANVNKHIDVIVKALGRDKSLQSKFVYHVIGSFVDEQYETKVKHLIDSYNLQDNVFLHGYVDDNTMSWYYQHADLISNLRYPAIEGASASLVEQLKQGKCIIVCNCGMYAEVPESCVFKVTTEDLEESVYSVLREIIGNPQAVLMKGVAAREYAIQAFSEEKYKESVFEFFDAVLFDRPMRELLQQLSQETSFMRVDSFMDTLTSELQDLYRVK